MMLFDGKGFGELERGRKFIVGFDDACHLLPFASKPKRLDDAPQLAKDLARQEFVVDKFHFRAHTGAYCHKHCCPHRLPILKSANMSVAEQKFSTIASYGPLFRCVESVWVGTHWT